MRYMDFRVFSYEKRGEGGIRTLGSLLGYGALAKRCFQPLSHLTKNLAENIAKNLGFPISNLRLPTPASSRARDFIGVANLSVSVCSYRAGQNGRRLLNFARSAGLAKAFGVGVRSVFASLSAHCDGHSQKRREDAPAL
jgi:hypothetical protein